VNLLIEKLFAQDLGLFEPKTEEETFYIVNPNANLKKIFFSGLIVGKALQELNTF
jgi:hypothetical protein